MTAARSPAPNTPVLAWDDLVEARGSSRVGGPASKFLTKRLGAEEDPLVLVLLVEGSLEIANRGQDGREIALMDERDECGAGDLAMFRGHVARRRRGRQRSFVDTDTWGGVEDNAPPSPRKEPESGKSRRRSHAGKT